MNAHQTYVANVIENLTAAEVAASCSAARQPGRRRRGRQDPRDGDGPRHRRNHGDLGRAVGRGGQRTKREEGGHDLGLPIAAMIFDIDMPEEAEQDGEPDGAPASVSTIGHTAEAAAEAA